VWYPGADRNGWSISATGSIEQNFEQAHTGIKPGDNFDVDWGIGKMVRVAGHAFDFGLSGFGTWQITTQSGGASTGRYHYQGIGPEIGTALDKQWAARIRFQWEFGTENAAQGNNIWLIVNYQP
jgi:hypothetical protein